MCNVHSLGGADYCLHYKCVVFTMFVKTTNSSLLWLQLTYLVYGIVHLFTVMNGVVHGRSLTNKLSVLGC